MSEIYLPAEDTYLLSEILKKEIPKILNKDSDLKIIEIGVGSGFNLQTLLDLGVKKQNILGTDINSSSIEHCKKLGFNCIKSDLFKNVKEKFNIILFNPPYLPEDSLEPASSRLATTGGKKGSEIINEFLKQSKKHLKPNGKIFLLTSSLTKGIKWQDYKKKLIGKKKLFFEELFVWKLRNNI